MGEPSTHWDTCWQHHLDCAIAKMQRECARADAADAQAAAMRAALEAVLKRDEKWAPSGMPNDCNCINLSRDAEREYETGKCPHQVARKALAPDAGKKVLDVIEAAKIISASGPLTSTVEWSNLRAALAAREG